MRTAALALILAIPAAALAQTPKDIAAQIWPLGPPASSNQAPAPGTAHQTGATPADLARLTWGTTLPAATLHAPTSPYVSAFNGAAILSLRATSSPVVDAPYLVGAR